MLKNNSDHVAAFRFLKCSLEAWGFGTCPKLQLVYEGACFYGFIFLFHANSLVLFRGGMSCEIFLSSAFVVEVKVTLHSPALFARWQSKFADTSVPLVVEKACLRIFCFSLKLPATLARTFESDQAVVTKECRLDASVIGYLPNLVFVSSVKR